jgi:ribosomal-protein-serine acetyltransferase
MNAELRAGNLLIRPFTAADIDAVYEAVRESIRELATWLAWCHPDYSKEETTAHILHSLEAWEQGDEFNFGIFDAETGAFIGGVGLNQINWQYRMANLGYWVRTSRAGRGVASMAARRVAEFGLEELGLQRIEIVVGIENRASQRTAEKTGARREGRLRKRLRTKGEPIDAVIYSFIAEDLIVKKEDSPQRHEV